MDDRTWGSKKKEKKKIYRQLFIACIMKPRSAWHLVKNQNAQWTIRFKKKKKDMVLEVVALSSTTAKP